MCRMKGYLIFQGGIDVDSCLGLFVVTDNSAPWMTRIRLMSLRNQWLELISWNRVPFYARTEECGRAV